METFFQQYRVYFIIGAIGFVVFGAILILVLVMNQQAPTEEPPVATDSNQLNYGFIQNQQFSDEDKLLMLQSKIIVEQYGTYSKDDLRGLMDVRNQATPVLQARIDSLINIVGEKNISTVVDPESVVLSRTASGGVQVKMNATETSVTTNTSRNVVVTVDLVKTGEYWQVSNILIQ